MTLKQILLCGATLWAVNCATAGDSALTFASGQLEARNRARLESGAAGIKLSADSPEWDAGLRINPPAGEKFDFSHAGFLAVDVENLNMDRQMRLTMHVFSGKRGDKSGASHVAEMPLREVNTGIGLNPGEKRTMRLYLPHAKLFTAPADGKNMRRPLDTDKINSIEFKMQWPFEAGRQNLLNCRLSNFRLEGTPDLTRQVRKDGYFPFIDVYGQYKHAAWPEKIKSDGDLKKAHAGEKAAMRKIADPAEWNKFGGWENGPQLKGTGAFRVEKYNDKWYFVDPAGKLFWSFGIDVLRTHTDAVRGTGHEKWFSQKVPADGMLPFTQWNLQKKYGKKSYDGDFYDFLTVRLRKWGVNTIGNWGSPEFMAKRQMPYTMSLGELIRGVPRLGKYKIYDVYAPEFTAKVGNLLRDRAAADPRVKESLNDPVCIGYFIDNELQFNNITRGVMGGDSAQPSKAEFMRRMRSKYGKIERLNAAWETAHKNWDGAISATDMPRGEEFRKDFAPFMKDFVERYFSTCRRAVKSVAPHRLYLGCRFVGFRQAGAIWESAAANCDVVSVNTYSNSVNNVNRGDFRDRPVLIGEFHFGTYDRGMFSPSLCPVGDQQERATALTRFMQGALVQPNFVGAHYFQFRDQPLTGRHDGEGYQIGFVDVADTPYPEMTAAARRIGENMYNYRAAGKLKNEMK